MNLINRLEECWTPSWDLGLQDEFGFAQEEDLVVEAAVLNERPNAWKMASKETINRVASEEGPTVEGNLSKDDLIRFLENLSAELSNDE